MKDIKGELVKVEGEVIEHKKKKLNRDVNDFKSNLVYSWQRKRKNGRFQGKNAEVRLRSRYSWKWSSRTEGIFEKTTNARVEQRDTIGNTELLTVTDETIVSFNLGLIATENVSVTDLRVVSLSDFIVTPTMQKVLTKGGKFVPTKFPALTDVLLDVKRFCRKLYLKVFFNSQIISNDMASDRNVSLDDSLLELSIYDYESLENEFDNLVSADSVETRFFLLVTISPGAMHPILSDKLQFPSFLRTVSGNQFQNFALAQLIKRFGWTWVGLLTADNDVGIIGSQDLKTQIEKTGGCVAFHEKIHALYPYEKFYHITQLIRQSSVNVIIINSDEVHTKAVLDSLYVQNVSGKVLVLSVLCIITPGFFSKETWKLLNGTIGLVPYSSNMPGFENFLDNQHPFTFPDNIFIKSFWEIAFGCKWLRNYDKKRNDSEDLIQGFSVCDGMEQFNNDHLWNLFELSDLSNTYQVYLAVYAFAHALDSLTSCSKEHGLFVNGSCSTGHDIQSWQVLQHLKSVSFVTKTGEKMHFDINGDAVAMYDIINVQINEQDMFRTIKVGRVNPTAPQGEEMSINMSAILWNEIFDQVPTSLCSERCSVGYRKIVKRGQPVCCFNCATCSSGEIANETDTNDCLKCPEDQWPNEQRDKCALKNIEFLSYREALGVTVATVSVSMSFTAVLILCVFIRFRDTPIVKANNLVLSYILLSALTLCFLCSLIFIGQPMELTCILRQTAFGVIFTISVSIILAKTITVVIAFSATNPNSKLRNWVGSKIPYSIVVFCSLMQIIICSSWLSVSPPFPELHLKSKSITVIYECNEGKRLFFYCMLGYIGLLATVSFIVAFLARKLPDSFNEAKYITFSMFGFVSVWLSFIPAYLSTQGKYMVAVEIFAILSSSAGLLICIFGTKCYTILLRPDQNVKQRLIGK
ncbi:extracellular calcium-sensing receptor-like [Protopterus annectens]|uniref:extracellular calcium-sensing receptor-like n=1 Tax=Protopterus annectens TaxID=7888 RepID=UPI001CFC04AD|nr:extracellular calcium-sensing receptor-like [Protopterus annectens]